MAARESQLDALPAEPDHDETEELDALGWIYATARQDARQKRERDSAPPNQPERPGLRPYQGERHGQ